MRYLKGHGTRRTVHAVTFAPDGRHLASWGLDGTIRLWDLESGDEVAQKPGRTVSLCFLDEGKQLAWGGQYGVRVWDIAADTVREYPQSGVGPMVSFGRSLTCTATGLQTLDLTTGAWSGWHESDVCRSLALTSEGHTLATGSFRHLPGARSRTWRYEHGVILWDVVTRTETARLLGPTQEIGDLAFSPDGRSLAVCSGPTLWVWDVPGRKPLATKKIDNLHFKSVAFSPDGRWLATARNDATVRLFSTADWSEGPAYDWQLGKVVSVAFAPDGMRAAAGGSKGKIVVWDVD